MFTVHYISHRTSNDAEWWHLLPENKSWIDQYEIDMINKSLMISCVNETSEDGLSFRRVSVWESKEKMLEAFNLLPVPEYREQRMIYNMENDHIGYIEEFEDEESV